MVYRYWVGEKGFDGWTSQLGLLVSCKRFLPSIMAKPERIIGMIDILAGTTFRTA